MKGVRFARGPLSLVAALAALPRVGRLYARLMADPRVALAPKLLVVGALAYLISPLDLAPDLLVPGLGHLDDIAILWLAFQALVRLAPPEVVAEHGAGPARGGR